VLILLNKSNECHSLFSIYCYLVGIRVKISQMMGVLGGYWLIPCSNLFLLDTQTKFRFSSNPLILPEFKHL